MADERIAKFREQFGKVTAGLQKVIVGQDFPVKVLCTAFFAGGHILLEGVPGLGKTLLASSFARLSGLEFKRIQFTPDLMPADITGTHVIAEKDGQRELEFRQGPLFANIVLADEINRATPKTQSALLEGMQEHSVTSGRDTIPLPAPFMVIGTQNPIEMKGTYPLPEAQKDRFMFKIDMTAGSAADLAEVLRRTTGTDQEEITPEIKPDALADMIATVREVAVPEHLREMAARAVMLTSPEAEDCPAHVKKYVRLGASIRGGQALIAGAQVDALLEGQANITADGLGKYLRPAMRHRLVLNFEAGADGVTADDILKQVDDILKKE